MTNPTTPFSWQMPTATDLVTDLPADFETFGQAVATSLADLLGGTTGQVLAKASNTDMDFNWVAQDDSNAIQNAIVDAKGDLIAASAADTPARLAVGNNGETLVADSSASTGLRYTSNFAAGKNKIINGDFAINQRAFSSTTTTDTYGFDRIKCLMNDGTVTYSAQTFTAGTAPVSGYEAKNFGRIVTTGQTSSSAYGIFLSNVEDVRTLAGQTATVSFWAKAASGTPKVTVEVQQNFGAGGSPSADVQTYGGQVTLSTAWTRYSVTVSIPSINGKTIGTTSPGRLDVYLWVSAGSAFNSRSGTLGIQSNTFDFWGLQLEAGSVATAFQTATGTIQGELAACQRYYYVLADGTTQSFGTCAYFTATDVLGTVFHPVTMRTSPTFTAAAGSFYEVVRNGASDGLTGLQANFLNTRNANIFADTGNGASGTAGHGGQYRTTSASANIAFSAEL